MFTDTVIPVTLSTRTLLPFQMAAMSYLEDARLKEHPEITEKTPYRWLIDVTHNTNRRPRFPPKHAFYWMSHSKQP